MCDACFDLLLACILTPRPPHAGRIRAALLTALSRQAACSISTSQVSVSVPNKFREELEQSCLRCFDLKVMRLVKHYVSVVRVGAHCDLEFNGVFGISARPQPHEHRHLCIWGWRSLFVCWPEFTVMWNLHLTVPT